MVSLTCDKRIVANDNDSLKSLCIQTKMKSEEFNNMNFSFTLLKHKIYIS